MVGLPLILGISIYIVIISVLAIWLKNYHARIRANLQMPNHSLPNEPGNLDRERLIKGTSNQKDSISKTNSQTTLESGDKSHK